MHRAGPEQEGMDAMMEMMKSKMKGERGIKEFAWKSFLQRYPRMVSASLMGCRYEHICARVLGHNDQFGATYRFVNEVIASDQHGDMDEVLWYHPIFPLSQKGGGMETGQGVEDP